MSNIPEICRDIETKYEEDPETDTFTLGEYIEMRRQYQQPQQPPIITFNGVTYKRTTIPTPKNPYVPYYDFCLR